ncbi:MAG: tetratricopeptide repeat protein, partial [Bryobacterales bacterium]|nr:tetratricopeptide repeat protein [Bryobacterales bacterium]
DGHRVLGQIALIEKNVPAAIKELDAANQASPLQPDVILSLVQALAENKQFDQGEKLAYQLIDKEKSYSPIYDYLYYAYAQQNRLADAERLLKLKTANNPQNASYLLQLAGHYYVSRQRPEMDAVIQRLSNEKEYPEGHLLAGDFFLFRLREFDHAEDQYQAAIKAFPKDKALYEKRLVELYASTNRSQQANSLLAAMVKENPKDPDTVAMRAALMLSTGDLQQINNAATDLQALVTKSPSNHLLRFNLARALVAKGDLEQARLQLEEAIKLRPDFVVARELLTRVHISRGDSGAALKAADDLIAIDPNNLQAHLARSSGLLGLGERDKARDELGLIVKAYPQNVDARYQVGYLAWEQKEFKQAEQIFADLHKANPEDPRGLVGMVETLASQNHLDDAIATMHKATGAEPDRRDLKLFLANLLVRDEKYDEAIQLFHELLNKEPRSADLLLRLAEAYRRKGDLNAAIDTFRRCSQAAPSDPTPLLQLGLLMEGTGRRDQAEPIYEQILKIRPDHAVALNNLAFIKADRGADLDQALSMAQKARQQQPASLAFADTLGWIYIKKNLPEQAVSIFTDLVMKAPSNSTYHYHYGMALRQKGDKSSARREFEMAIKNNPPQEERLRIQEMLQKM